MLIMKEITVKDFGAEAMPHFNDIFRTALRLTKIRSEAKNLIKKVYLQAWKTYRFCKPQTNCRVWLFRILFSKFNHCRKKNINSKFFEESGDTLRNLNFTLAVAVKTLRSCLKTRYKG